MSEVKGMEARHKTDNVSLTTTDEVNVIGHTLKAVEKRTSRFLVRASAVVQSGSGTTTVTPRIRRGIGVGGAVVGEEIAIVISASPGNNEVFTLAVVDEQESQAAVSYSLTLQQSDATGNGTALFSSIEIYEF